MRIRAKATGSLSLAEKVSTPLSNVEDYAIWLYGPPKIGKTTVSTMFPSCHHFMFEAGAKALRIKQRIVKTWAEWLEYQKLWARSDFVTATVDVVEIAYEMCFSHMCNEMGIDHPSDENDMGKSWGRIRQAFMESMTFMQRQPGKGCIFISHASSTKRKTAEGDEVDDIHPALTGKPMEALAGSMDVIGYMHTRKGKRVIQIRGDDCVMAGCRLEENFLHTDGTPVKFIPMGNNKREAFDNFLKAFNNELEPEQKQEKKPLVKFRIRKT